MANDECMVLSLMFGLWQASLSLMALAPSTTNSSFTSLAAEFIDDALKNERKDADFILSGYPLSILAYERFE